MLPYLQASFYLNFVLSYLVSSFSIPHVRAAVLPATEYKCPTRGDIAVYKLAEIQSPHISLCDGRHT